MPASPEEIKASLLLRKAIENHDPMSSNYIRGSCVDMYTRLVLDGSNEEQMMNVALHYAVRGGSQVIVDTLLDYDKDSALIRNEEGYTPLHDAVAEGNFMIVSTICRGAAHEFRVSKDAYRYTKLYLMQPYIKIVHKSQHYCSSPTQKQFMNQQMKVSYQSISYPCQALQRAYEQSLDTLMPSTPFM